MKYLSTRGSKADSFKDVLMQGLANDGGLFVPDYWPKIDVNSIHSNIDYSDLTFKVISEFIGDDISESDLMNIIKSSYNENFSKKDPVTFKSLSNKEIIIELFNGPTFAFKDFAMQLLIPIFDHFLNIENKKMNLIVATSGDTGSAAINAVNKSKNLNIFCLYPKNRISEFQRRQMSTVKNNQVHLFEIDGTFDDCQNIVKTILSDLEFSKKNSISAVNSINWARVMIQAVYYFYSALRLDNGKGSYNFSVPTGNFGDVYAGYISKKMGLNINKLIVATNENDILDRFLKSGEYATAKVLKTTSPSMDIQVASNFERFLFDLLDCSPELTNEKMNDLKNTGKISITEEQLKKAQALLLSNKATMQDVNETILDVYKNNSYLLDPHTAIGLFASRKQLDTNENNFILGTAHPVKFMKTVEEAISDKLDLQDDHKNLFNEVENITSLDNDVELMKNEILQKS